MAIEITSSSILKPCPSSPHPLTNTHVTLTIFDLAAMDLHVPTVHAFRAPMPGNSELKDGLSRVLAHYPHLAGRLSVDGCGQPSIWLNNAGVRLVEATVSATLAEKMPLEATTNLTELHPSVEGVEELLQVQLNRYACGGVVIGFTCHHRTADGQSLSQFLASWAEIVRNPTSAAIPAPYLDRASISSVPRDPPRCKFNHLEIEFKKTTSSSNPKVPTTNNIDTNNAPDITNFVARFSAGFIAQLKSKVPERSSTFECLLAHVWRKITVARGLKEDEFTQVRIAVNGRARMRPAVPMRFFGNLVLWAHPKARAGELVRSGQAHAVNVIRDAVSRINDDYFKSFIDFGEIVKREDLVGSAPESGSALCPNLEVDSWLRFNFHELDFGSGGPCSFLPPNLPVEGLMVFVPSYKEKGGVDVYLALFQKHVDLFNKICYSLD